jgi:hypothetical protein
VAEAQKMMERVQVLARKSQDHERRLRTELVSAEVDAAAGARTRALDTLAAVVQKANESGMVELALEARLARAARAHAAGRQDAPGALEDVIREAEARGFIALTKKARAVKGSH